MTILLSDLRQIPPFLSYCGAFVRRSCHGSSLLCVIIMPFCPMYELLMRFLRMISRLASWHLTEFKSLHLIEMSGKLKTRTIHLV